MSRIAVAGSGSWGTALAWVLSQRHHSVTLWSHSALVADAIAATRENTRYLPKIILPAEIAITTELAEAVIGAEIIVLAVPAQHVRATFSAMAPLLRPSQAVVSAAKGIEENTMLRMSQVVEQVWAGAQTMKISTTHPIAGRIAVLSGPSFAREVAEGLPTAITVASQSSSLALRIQQEFRSPSFRPYTNNDVVGVELGGALKNVMAIAAGVASGLRLGHNAVAALIPRGIAEISRLAIACGGYPETLAGLAGTGDLVLTATGALSRNRFVGIELGRGRSLPEILQSLDGRVAEGIRTTAAALGLARSRGVEMPITEQVASVLEQRTSPREAIDALMSRPDREE